MPAYTDRQENGFSSIATCVFALANIDMAAYTFCIHICEHRSFKGQMTLDMGYFLYFLAKFWQHFFSTCDAYFAKVLQMNTLCSTEHISHMYSHDYLVCIRHNMTGQPSHVPVFRPGVLGRLTLTEAG
jgi:hypothetical protein